MRYELCYLVGESKEQDLQKIKEEIGKIVSQEGGSFLEPQFEEKRKMAYKVGRDVRGIYVAQQFEVEESEDEAKENAIDKISRKINLYQEVLRFIIVKAEDLPELKIREPREAFKKDFRKPAYIKKSEPLKAKEEVKKEIVKKESEEMKKEEANEEKDSQEKTETKDEAKKEKSIEEKIDEILNI